MKMGRMILAAAAGLSLALGAATETRLDVVDVMVAFDQSAQQWLADNGGVSVDEFAQAQIDRVNLCLRNSGLDGDFTFRLAGTMVAEVDASAMTVPDVLVNGLQSSAKATGAWKQVWQKRDALGADLFSFVIGGAAKGGVAGLGYTLAVESGRSVSESVGLATFTDGWIRLAADGFCFNVLSLEALVREGDYTMAHEIAHNMGCGHSDAEGVGERFYEFSAGCRFGSYVSVMGYASEGYVVAPVFSSPSVTYDGLVTGDATHDNVRTLRNNYRAVAQYRVSLSAPAPVDPPPAVDPQPEDPPPAAGPDPAPVDPPAELEPVLGFTPSGAFGPLRAVNAVAPYVGGVYDEEGRVCGVLQLKVGKKNDGKGSSKVSGAVVLMSGKKHALKAVEVKTGSTPGVRDGIVVTGLGTLSLAVADNGFSGRIATANGTLLVKTAAVGGDLASRGPVFRMEAVDALESFPVLASCLPDGTEIGAANGRWTLPKAAKVKYAKVKGATPAAYELVIDEGRNGANVNRSGLKLSYAAKTGLFKGSFTLYADAGTEAKPKLKKYKASVVGMVVDGVGYGQAACKKPAMSWPVEIW